MSSMESEFNESMCNNDFSGILLKIGENTAFNIIFKGGLNAIK